MWKKIVAIFVLLSAALWGTLCWLLSNTQLERIANHFLAPNFSIEMAENIHVAAKGADIPSLALISNQTPSCTAVRLHHLRTDWWDQHKIRIEKAVIDYACLSTLILHSCMCPHMAKKVNLTISPPRSFRLVGAIIASTILRQRFSSTTTASVFPSH